eukprot:TRINITY_DN20422_c0_g1_i1.p1 TRINITY_DN20422_c0_g1~~TRINITY_DN20422_c0_g1_i1.p1  ORF type:complete len:303 (+),score=31.70 TRINITY_DN20422_c0_g1_i1:90-998(+)
MAKVQEVTDCAAALQIWKVRNKVVDLTEVESVNLADFQPPICKMDDALTQLATLNSLSLSGNAISQIGSLWNATNLRILNLERNKISTIDRLDEVGATLKELYLACNLLRYLDGLYACVNLDTLDISRNCIQYWPELRKLDDCPRIRSVLVEGNPMSKGYTKYEARSQALCQLPSTVTQIDGRRIKVITMTVSPRLTREGERLIEATFQSEFGEQLPSQKVDPEFTANLKRTPVKDAMRLVEMLSDSNPLEHWQVRLPDGSALAFESAATVNLMGEVPKYPRHGSRSPSPVSTSPKEMRIMV